MSQLQLLTREQIAAIFKEPRAIRAYEALQLALANAPDQLDALGVVPFLTLAADPAVPMGRTLAVNPRLSLVDGGAGNAVTLDLAAIGDDTLLANTTGGGVPVATTLSALLDSVLGAAQGQIITRNAGTWTVLAPAVAGNVLQSGGPGANISYFGGVAVLTDAATIAMDASIAPSYRVVLSAAIGPARVWGAPTAPVDGSKRYVRIKQPAAGVAQTISAWPASFKWAGGAAGVLSTANNAQDLLELQYDAADATYDARLSLAYA